MSDQLIDGRYRIIRRLGMGGFGCTYVAEDIKQFNSRCVVKQLKPMVNHSEAMGLTRRLFESEARLLHQLGKSDRIPGLLAYFEENKEFYLVQELIEGQDLSQEIIPGKKFQETFVLQLLIDILEPLAFIHQQGVIHRDIKPSNLMRREADGKIVLIDFGAVKQIATTQVFSLQATTVAGTIIGTPGYMPSEQGQGTPKLSSDVYAVGVIGLQCLTGKKAPSRRMLPDELQEDPHTAEIIWRDEAQISNELGEVLDTMVRYDFRQRYPSAQEALVAIQEIAGISPSSINDSDLAYKPTELPTVPATVPQPKALSQKLSQNSFPVFPEPKPPSSLGIAIKIIKKTVAGFLLLIGVPIILLVGVEALSPTTEAEDREGALAALFLFGMPPTLAGCSLLWSVSQQNKLEKQKREQEVQEYLQSVFFHLVSRGKGRISLLGFSQAASVSGEVAQKFLEEKAQEFDAHFDVRESGTVTYHFKI